MRKPIKVKTVWIVVVVLSVCCAAAVDYAIAQSSAISLDSPASFPVDI